MEILVLLIAFGASVVGAICGIGGGVIIKPLLDAFGIASVAEISFLSGSTPMLVLSLLTDGDKYGYEMVEELAKRSDDTFQLKEGTLYPLLHAMEKEKLVRAYSKLSPNGRERKYYQLTDSGREQLEYKEREWRLFSEKVNAVLGRAGA